MKTSYSYCTWLNVVGHAVEVGGGGGCVNHPRLCQSLESRLYRNVPLPLFYVHLLCFAQFSDCLSAVNSLVL